jgi:hypothetical protein
MRPENDITLVAEQLLGNWDNVQIIHVKSHQSVEKELSWAAQLNNIADAQATEQRTKMTAPASRVTNTTKGMLYISGKAITRDAQQQAECQYKNIFNTGTVGQTEHSTESTGKSSTRLSIALASVTNNES